MAAHSESYQQHSLPPPPPEHHQPQQQQQQYEQPQPPQHQQQQQYQQPSQYEPQQPNQQYQQPVQYQHQQYQQQQQQQPQYQQQQYQQQQSPQQQQPQKQYPPPARPQASHQRNSHSKGRSFSFQSQKSHKSSGSKDHTLHETHEEKEAKRLHSKADPSLAISEDEPSVVAAMMTQSSLAPLRSISHKDSLGNPIADPDKSNPTRSRWERPLDTIRSFEAAIDGGYSRKSLYRTETDPVAQWNRRASYNPAPQPRFQRDSYYSQRPVSHRPDLGGYDGAGPSASRNSYYDQQHGYGGPYQQGPPRRLSRMQTEPHYHGPGREQNIYPMPHKDRSYETVTSAAASGNSDHAGYQTDPTSSDNSSIERQSPAKRPEPQQPVNDYGIGFSQPNAYQPPSFATNAGGPSGATHPLPPTPAGQQQVPPPQVPRKDAPSVLKRQATQEQNSEKRKSWFSRRFSKNA